MRALEARSGRVLRTRADVRAYLEEIDAGGMRSAARWTFAKRVLLALGLVLAFLQYYLLDVYVQILSMRQVTFMTGDARPEPARDDEATADAGAAGRWGAPGGARL